MSISMQARINVVHSQVMDGTRRMIEAIRSMPDATTDDILEAIGPQVRAQVMEILAGLDANLRTEVETTLSMGFKAAIDAMKACPDWMTRAQVVQVLEETWRQTDMEDGTQVS